MPLHRNSNAGKFQFNSRDTQMRIILAALLITFATQAVDGETVLTGTAVSDKTT